MCFLENTHKERWVFSKKHYFIMRNSTTNTHSKWISNMHKGLSHFGSLVQTAFELLDLSTLTSKAS